MAERKPERNWIVEGAGGALVPLNSTETMADLIVRLALPAVVVSRTTLGTINHTLMTLEVLRHHGVTVAGVVFVGHPNPDNRVAIEQFGNVPTLGEMPLLSPLSPDALAAWATAKLDASGMLSGLFWKD
jgi:dethiobiotin synthetase